MSEIRCAVLTNNITVCYEKDVLEYEQDSDMPGHVRWKDPLVVHIIQGQGNKPTLVFAPLMIFTSENIMAPISSSNILVDYEVDDKSFLKVRQTQLANLNIKRMEKKGLVKPTAAQVNKFGKN